MAEPKTKYDRQLRYKLNHRFATPNILLFFLLYFCPIALSTLDTLLSLSQFLFFPRKLFSLENFFPRKKKILCKG